MTRGATDASAAGRTHPCGMTSPIPLDSSGAAARPVRLRAARGGILVLGGGFAGSYVARSHHVLQPFVSRRGVA